ncbi:MAG: hypothetical protein GQ546_09165 [Gammaproteobacteria bacterium]|nr:hypothetical protein [Gammaproteobacteria bacterium]
MTKNKGFSLVSLMVASAIGIFLVSGVMKIYLDSKNSFNFRTSVASAHENARFAIQDLQRTLTMAGWGVDAGDDSPQSYKNNDNGKRTFPAVENNKSSSSSTAGIVDIDDQGSSIIAVRLAKGQKPCGVAEGASATTKVRFYINSNNELVCDAGTAQPIISGIVKMRALYGVETDTGSSSDGMANNFLTASEVDSQNKWANVVSIRIGLIVSSDQTIPATFRPDNIEAKDLLGDVVTLPDKDHFFKSVNTTIAFRNLHASVKRQ